MSEVNRTAKIVELRLKEITPEYLAGLAGVMQEIAAEYNLKEPQAVALIGTALEQTNLCLETSDIRTMVDAARRKDITELTANERALMFAGGWIVRTAPFETSATKVGRNAPCPCKSGKKYKNCCLPLARTHDSLRYKYGK